MRKFYFLFLLQFSLMSCFISKTKVNNTDHLLSVFDNPSDSSYFCSHFELAEIVAIQKNKDFIISDIKKVIRYKNKIILLEGTQSSIYIIDATNGKLECVIKKWGRGPGESRTIIDIAFYEELEQIIIFNDYAKMLFFDIKGEFLYEEEVGNLYEEISLYEHEVIFYSKLEGYSCYPYAFKVFNIKTKNWRDAGNNTKIDFHIRSRGRNLVKSKQIWFAAPLDYSLSVFRNSQIYTSIKLDISGYTLNDRLIKLSISDPFAFFMEVNSNSLIYSFNSIRETPNHIVFKSNQNGFFIIEKANNKLYWNKFNNECFMSSLVNYYPHDGNDGKIMFILPAHEYIHHTNNSMISALGILEIKEDDNPILIFFKEKQLP